MNRKSKALLLVPTVFAATALAFGGPGGDSYTHPGAMHAIAAAAPVAAAGDEHVAIAAHTIKLGVGGYSPVSYIERNEAEPGSPLYATEYEGVTYFFTGERQKEMFLKTPKRYLPAFGGFCAFGCSVDSEFIPDPTSFEVIDGRTHLFLKNDEVIARELWNEGDERQLTRKARSHWRKVSGS